MEQKLYNNWLKLYLDWLLMQNSAFARTKHAFYELKSLYLHNTTHIYTMQTANINKLFEIHVEEMESWEKRPYKNNFFEIVYVEKGEGEQCINDHVFKYTDGNIFLLPPLDCHSFKITKPSRFYIIRFTDHYFLQNCKLMDYEAWFDKIAYIIANYSKVPGDIITSERERQFMIDNIKYMYHEYLSSDYYSEGIITSAMASILNLLARNIEKQYVERGNESDSRFGEILRYINNNIVSQDKLHIPELAEQFGISKSYFSEYFKKQAGVNLAEYIVKSKLKIVETKVIHTDLSLKEMAYQMNFTDSSHLSKVFKKQYGMTIKAYRMQAKSTCTPV